MESVAEENNSSRIFVGGLFDGVTESDLRDKFGSFGEITTVDIKVKEGAGNTFAFIEMKAPPSKVTRFLTTFSSTIWKGGTLKLQLAKESFLTRLQKERESRLANRSEPSTPKLSYPFFESNGFGGCNALPVGHYENKPFANRSNRRWDGDKEESSTNDRRFSASISRTEPIVQRELSITQRLGKLAGVDVGEPPPPPPPSKSIFLDRLEKFSSGVWRDESETPFEVVTEDYTMKTTNTVEDDDYDDEAGFTNNLVRVKKRKVERARVNDKKIESPSLLVNAASSKKHVGVNDPKIESPSLLANAVSSRKHMLSNERRLQTLGEKMTAIKLQQSLVKAALLNVDSAASRKIVFEPDDEDAAKDARSYRKNKEVNEKLPKKLELFKEDEFEDENNGECDKVEPAFQFKPQFQGESGQKLIELQTQYGNDTRFNIDKRFVEDDENGEEPMQDGMDVNDREERLRNFSVLESVLGYQVQIPKDGDPRRNTKHWTEMIPQRYDPAREGHEKYEIQRDAADLPPPKPSAKSSKRLRREQEQRKKLELPEVTNQQFFEVEQNLADAFKSKPDAGTFSLSKLFDFQEANRDDYQFDAEPTTVSSGPRTFWNSNPFTYDSSDEEDDEANGRGRQSEDSRWDDQQNKGPETDESHLVTSAKRQTFFLFKDDPRLKEGAESFKRQEDLRIIEDKWRSTREELLHRMRMKRKRLLGKIAESQKRVKQDINKGSANRKFLRPKRHQQIKRKNNRRNFGNKHGTGEQRRRPV